jgi:hypothetical protein
MIIQYFSAQETYKHVTRRFSILSSDSPVAITERLCECPLPLGFDSILATASLSLRLSGI